MTDVTALPAVLAVVSLVCVDIVSELAADSAVYPVSELLLPTSRFEYPTSSIVIHLDSAQLPQPDFSPPASVGALKIGIFKTV